MEEIKTAVLNEEYLRVVPRIAYYLKSKNMGAIYKSKYPLFATVGEEGRIYLLTNSLEAHGLPLWTSECNSMPMYSIEENIGIWVRR